MSEAESDTEKIETNSLSRQLTLLQVLKQSNLTLLQSTKQHRHRLLQRQ